MSEQDILDGKVPCAICGKYYVYVAIAHLAKHGITGMEEYKKKYPEAKITGKAFSVMRKNLASIGMTERWRAGYSEVYSSIHNKKSIEKRVKTRNVNFRKKNGIV